MVIYIAYKIHFLKPNEATFTEATNMRPQLFGANKAGPKQFEADRAGPQVFGATNTEAKRK